jgi:hypothetical protein
VPTSDESLVDRQLRAWDSLVVVGHPAVELSKFELIDDHAGQGGEGALATGNDARRIGNSSDLP